jgi:hypothetical protein
MKHLGALTGTVRPVADFLTSSKRTGSLRKRLGHVLSTDNEMRGNVERSVLTLQLTDVVYSLTVRTADQTSVKETLKRAGAKVIERRVSESCERQSKTTLFVAKVRRGPPVSRKTIWRRNSEMWGRVTDVTFYKVVIFGGVTAGNPDFTTLCCWSALHYSFTNV